MAPLEPAELYEASPREMLLFGLYLYQHLPHYVPKATLSFAGGLHEPLTREIELTNPAKKPLVYEVRLKKEHRLAFRLDECPHVYVCVCASA